MPDQIILVRHHHEDPLLVLLATPPDLASVMGRFQPARYVGLRAGSYVLPLEQLANLGRFAAAQHITLIDERRPASRAIPAGPARPLPECAHCGQPAKRDARLAHCPACGQPWRPIQYSPDVDAEPIINCPACLQPQRPGFPHCSACGAALPTTAPSGDDEPNRDATSTTTDQQPRPRLPDPLPIAASIDDLIADQANR